MKYYFISLFFFTANAFNSPILFSSEILISTESSDTEAETNNRHSFESNAEMDELIEIFSQLESEQHDPQNDNTTMSEDGLEILKLINSGSHGTIHKAKITKNGHSQEVALKTFKNPLENLEAPGLVEAQDSPYFLKYSTYSHNGNFQLCELGGENLLTDFLLSSYAGNQPEQIAARSNLFHDIFDGISILHLQEGKAHWDLKPENMLHGFDNRIKIIDLDGLSPPTSPQSPGTFNWLSPERMGIFEQQKYNFQINGASSDIYTLGLMLLSAKYGGSANDIVHLMEKCCKKTIRVNEEFTSLGVQYIADREDLWNELNLQTIKMPDCTEKSEMQLITDMLRLNPENRPKIDSIQARWQAIYPINNKKL